MAGGSEFFVSSPSGGYLILDGARDRRSLLALLVYWDVQAPRCARGLPEYAGTTTQPLYIVYVHLVGQSAINSRKAMISYGLTSLFAR